MLALQYKSVYGLFFILFELIESMSDNKNIYSLVKYIVQRHWSNHPQCLQELLMVYIWSFCSLLLLTSWCNSPCLVHLAHVVALEIFYCIDLWMFWNPHIEIWKSNQFTVEVLKCLPSWMYFKCFVTNVTHFKNVRWMYLPWIYLLLVAILLTVISWNLVQGFNLVL